MSNHSQMFEDFGFDQLADQHGESYDYHPAGGDELEAIVGILESRSAGIEVDQVRYENAVEVLHVAFKNDADVGIAAPAAKDYITAAGGAIRYYYNSTAADNGTWRSMVWVRHAEIRSGARVGDERGYR